MSKLMRQIKVENGEINRSKANDIEQKLKSLKPNMDLNFSMVVSIREYFE